MNGIKWLRTWLIQTICRFKNLYDNREWGPICIKLPPCAVQIVEYNRYPTQVFILPSRLVDEWVSGLDWDVNVIDYPLPICSIERLILTLLGPLYFEHSLVSYNLLNYSMLSTLTTSSFSLFHSSTALIQKQYFFTSFLTSFLFIIILCPLVLSLHLLKNYSQFTRSIWFKNLKVVIRAPLTHLLHSSIDSGNIFAAPFWTLSQMFVSLVMVNNLRSTFKFGSMQGTSSMLDILLIHTCGSCPDMCQQTVTFTVLLMWKSGNKLGTFLTLKF